MEMPLKPDRKNGSALLLTILITSLLMVIVLSFTAYTRIELRRIQDHQQQREARLNARVAVQLALNALQMEAGQDQRITARAELTGSTNGSRFWTGVWKSDGSGGLLDTPTWLVSGRNPDPATPGSFQILPPLAGQSGVNVDLEFLSDTQGNKLGELAYWISDEGVKTSVGKVDPTLIPGLSAASRGITDTDETLLQHVTPGRLRNEFLTPTFTDWDQEAGNVLKITRIPQLTHIGLSASDLDNNRHRITLRHFGVLSDPENGGLKQDLSFIGSGPGMDALSQDPNLQGWLSIHSAENGHSVYGTPTLPAHGRPVNTLPLILTEFGLYFRFSRVGNANTLRLQTVARVEFWNPNSIPLTFDPSVTEDLVIEVQDLPELSCNWITGTSHPANPPVIQTGSFTLNPNDITFTHADDNSVQFRPDRIPIDIKFIPLASGFVYQTSTSGEIPIGQALTSDSTATNADDYIEIQGPESEVTLLVKTPDGTVIQEFTDIPFSAIDTTGRRSPNDDLTGSQVNSRDSDEFQLVFYFRLDDETPVADASGMSPIEEWFNTVDPRSLSFPSSLYDQEILLSPPDEAAMTSLFQSLPDLFRYSLFPLQQFPAFDIPVVPPVSIGALQHLQFANTPPYSVGNRWGNQPDGYGNPFNSYFDRYFLSSVPQGASAWDPRAQTPLANSHLVVRESARLGFQLSVFQHPFSSTNFLVEGAVNLNSTDATVWKSILGSLNLQAWNYDGGITDIQYGMFRLPMGAHTHALHPSEDEQPGETYPEVFDKEVWFRDSTFPSWSNAFRFGARELSQQNLQDLADEITSRIQNRNVPFASIRELADSGIIQDALDATDINTTNGAPYTDPPPAGSSTRFPLHAPSYVSQADILQLLAPFVQVRSDTFVIRAFATSETGGTATNSQECEVIVQRIPEPVTFTNPADSNQVRQDYITPPDPFGRRFEIVSFQWLPEGSL